MIKVIHRSVLSLILLPLVLILTLLFFNACTGQSMTIKKAPENILYEMGEQEALSLVRWVMATVLPDQDIHLLKYPRLGFLVHETLSPGHQKYARFRETIYIYEVDLFLYEGVMPNDGKVAGYSYAIKGNGDLKSGPDKLVQLERRLKEAFDGSGRAVEVASVVPATPAPPLSKVPATSPGKPSTVAPSEKPAVQEAPAPAAPKDEDVFVKLRELKKLLDQGVITEEEFKAKKKELLDRI